MITQMSKSHKLTSQLLVGAKISNIYIFLLHASYNLSYIVFTYVKVVLYLAEIEKDSFFFFI